MKLDHSKKLRTLCNELSKMTKEELAEFNKALQKNIYDLSAGAIKKQVRRKKYKIKADQHLFFTGAGFHKALALNSASFFANDKEVTSVEINKLLSDILSEKKLYKDYRSKLNKYHKEIVKYLISSGVPIKNKKPVPK